MGLIRTRYKVRSVKLAVSSWKMWIGSTFTSIRSCLSLMEHNIPLSTWWSWFWRRGSWCRKWISMASRGSEVVLANLWYATLKVSSMWYNVLYQHLALSVMKSILDDEDWITIDVFLLIDSITDSNWWKETFVFWLNLHDALNCLQAMRYTYNLFRTK